MKDVEKYPTEYKVKNGNITVQMVLQIDYAELRSAYFLLKHEFELLKQAQNDV